MRLRIEKLELKMTGVERRLWVFLLLIILSLLMSTKGALSGILVGYAALEVSYSMIDPIIIFAIVAGVGSFLRIYLGYLKAKEKYKASFDWQMALISVVPAVSAALGSTILMDVNLSASNVLLVFFGAMGVNSLQDKFGLQKKN